MMLLILGMAIVTYLPRFLPLYLLTKIKIPEIVVAWLRYVPVAVLSALIMPGIFTVDKQFAVSFSHPYLPASILAFLVAYRTKNMMLTVSIGMVTVLIWQVIF